MQQQAEEDVLRVSQTLDRLLALDTVQVELIPEKKGLFLKHVEYQVTSQASYPVIQLSSHRRFCERDNSYFYCVCKYFDFFFFLRNNEV